MVTMLACHPGASCPKEPATDRDQGQRNPVMRENFGTTNRSMAAICGRWLRRNVPQR
jgi:hypothetical protein